MKKLLSVLSVLLLFSATEKIALANEGALPKNEQKDTDQVIITLKEDASINLKNSDTVSSDPEGNEQLVSVEVPDDQTVDAFIEELEKHDDIQHAEPDYLVQLNYSPNDPHVSKSQYYHQKIETASAWDKTRGSADVIVAVIDDGIDVSHPELKSQIILPFDTVKENSSIRVGVHGTHVAGIIGSSMNNNIGGSGVAPDTKIMPINVFSGEFAYTSEIIQGIYHAVDQGADIINMSLGGYAYSNALNTAIQDAHKKGVVLIAAAGNERVENPYYPASYANVISVGSTTSLDKVSNFSNYGKFIDIAAPGSNIYSTLPESTYGIMNGTSMAAPMVTGVAALIKGSEPALSNIEIENRLYATADDLGVAGRDPFYGHGRVNARKALMIDFLPVPYVSGVFQYSTAVKGSTAALAKVTVKSGGAILAQGMADSEGRFKALIPKQPIGTKLIVFSTNEAGVVSKEKEVIVKDGLAPSVPIVNPVTSLSTSITGKAEVNAKVFAYIGTRKIGEAVASKGIFAIPIVKQKTGTSISVHAMDAAKNKSASIAVEVADKTAPAIPTVNLVKDSSLAITGKVESNVKVYAYAGKVKLGEAIAKNGAYSIKIAKQKVGTSIAVYAVDAANNKSTARIVKVASSSTDVVASKYATISGVNMRSGPSVKNNVVMVVPKGKTVTYVKKSGSWYMVKYGTKSGWIYNSFLKKS